MNSPILSVIIPTRNRSQYAVPAIRSALGSSDERLEVVVQDNSDGDELRRSLAEFGDRRLVYRHTRERLDMCANFARGLEAASGEYVTFLGDDDGINPEVVAAVDWAAAQNLDALAGGGRIRYCWPDHRYRYWGASAAGTLEIGPFTGAVSAVDPRREIARCLQSGGSCFYDLPKIYYGLVRRDLLREVKGRAGRYFPGPSPDLAGAVAVACLARRAAKVDYPLFVPGTGAESMGGLGAMKKHVGRLEDFPHLPRSSVDNWSPLVPRFFSGNTIWGENAVEALEAMGEPDLLRDLDIAKLHALAMVFNPQFAWRAAKNLYPALGAAGRNLAWGSLKCAFYLCQGWLDRARSAAARLQRNRQFGDWRRVGGLSDIGAAVGALNAHLAGRNLSFAACATLPARAGSGAAEWDCRRGPAAATPE